MLGRGYSSCCAFTWCSGCPCGTVATALPPLHPAPSLAAEQGPAGLQRARGWRLVTVTVLAPSQGSQDASQLKHAVFLFPPMCSTKTKGERDSSLPRPGAAPAILSCSPQPLPPPLGLQRPCPGLVVLQGPGAACPLLPGWPSPCITCTSSPPLFFFQ